MIRYAGRGFHGRRFSFRPFVPAFTFQHDSRPAMRRRFFLSAVLATVSALALAPALAADAPAKAAVSTPSSKASTTS